MKNLISDLAFYLGFYWRWLLLPAFLIAAYVAWGHSEYVWGLLPFAEILHSQLVIDIVQYAVYAVMAILGFVALLAVISTIRKPFFEEMGINKRLAQTNFKNSDTQNPKYPLLLSKRRDKSKKYGVIYTFRNYGISVLTFEKRIHHLNTILKGRVYEILENKDTTKTSIYVIPKKYSTPNIIAENQNYLVDGLINLLCVGKTNVGKSYALAVILGALVRFNSKISVTICDYKKSSFAQFEDTPNFYGYEDVPNGIRAVYKEFTERLEANDTERNQHKRVLLIDEYGALIAAQDKKQSDELRTMVANMLFMGRSLGIILILGIQRADADLFKLGARDQFWAILALGNLSKEQKQMLFADYKDEMVANNRTGEGYMFIDGVGIERVKVAPINDRAALDDVIRQAMMTPIKGLEG